MFTKALALRLQLRCGDHGLPNGITAEDVFNYVYAVFHSPEYRARYAEFLKSDYPRGPLPGSLKLFRALARLGCDLVSLHVMDSPKLEVPLSTYTGPRKPAVEKISFVHNVVWLDRGMTRGFKGVPEAVWNFHIGGYQVCDKWLKDRRDRTLSEDEIAHYQKIVVGLRETIKAMSDIDHVIEQHGGWPDAFASASE
jgi:predicted helicase